MAKRLASDNANLSMLNVNEVRIKRTKLNAGTTNTVTLTLPSSTGTIALTSDIGQSDVTLNTNQTITGEKTFSTNPKLTAIKTPSNYILTLPDASSGTVALTTNIPDVSDRVTLTEMEVIRNKTFDISSNTAISTFNATTFTTTNSHGLGVGDQISFPSVGSITGGIVANTLYTVATVPSTTQFTLTGLSTNAGTVGSAFYILRSRDAANYGSAGGLLNICDNGNATRCVRFDMSGSTVPTVLRFPTTTAAPIIFPATAGTVMVTSATQSLTGTTTFTGQMISTRAGNATSASAPIYVNPSSSTAMSGANNYFWTYFNNPVSSGSSTGQAATVTIAGGPTTAASGGNYALRILASQSTLPQGTVGAPSLVFGSAANTSGLYSSANNNVNVAISGVNLATLNSTGLAVSGLVSGTTLQSGNGALATPSIYMTGDTGTGFYRSAGGNWDWVTGGTSYFRTSNTGITSTAANIVNTTTTGGLRVGTNGTLASQVQEGVVTFTNVPITTLNNGQQTVTFPNAFTSTPAVILMVNAGGANFEKCIPAAFNVSTTQFSINLYNAGASTVTGNITVAWRAWF